MALCKRARCLAQNACQGAAAAAKAGSDAAAASVGAANVGTSRIHVPAFQMSNVGRQNSSNYQQASQYCQARQRDLCEQHCDPSKDQRQSQQLSWEKEGCAQSIGRIVAELGDGSSQAQQAAQQAQNTGQQAQQGQQGQGGSSGGEGSAGSGGQPPSGQEGQQQGQSAKGGTQPQTSAGFKGECAADDAYTKEACRAELSEACKQPDQARTARCINFNRQATAEQFCNSDARSICPTCSKRDPQRASPAELARICSVCGGSGPAPDPMFMDPANVQLCSQATAQRTGESSAFATMGAAAAAGGGGGSGMGEAGTAARLEDENKVLGGSEPSAREGLGAGVDSASGGGYTYGEGSSTSSSSDGGAMFPTLSPTSAGAQISRALAGSEASGMSAAASDVETRFGPSVFSISSEVLKNRCASGRLLHCAPKK